MPDETLNKLKDFEKLIKKCLISKYGTYMPQDKITLINETVFLNDDVLRGINSLEQARSLITRTVVGNTISMLNNSYIGDKDFFEYKDYINEGLKEYYSRSLAEEFGFELSEIPALENNYELIMLIKQRLDNGLDKDIFSNESIKLMDAEELEKLLKDNKNISIEEFVNEKKLTLTNDSDLTEEGIKIINEKLSDKSRLNLVYIDGKQFIKYVDLDGKVHLTDTLDSKVIGKAYKNGFANLKKDEKVDVDEFYKELIKLIDEIELTNPDEEKNKSENYEEMNMNKFVETHPKLEEKASENVLHASIDELPFADNVNVHLVGDDNKVVVTNNKNGEVEGVIINNESEGIVADTNIEGNELIEGRVLSHEEYEILYSQLDEGVQLNPEQIRLMQIYQSTNPNVPEEQIIEVEHAEAKLNSGIKPILRKNDYGFVNFYEMIYIASMSIGIALILILTIFKLVR